MNARGPEPQVVSWPTFGPNYLNMLLNSSPERLQPFVDEETQRIARVTLWVSAAAFILLIAIGARAWLAGHGTYGQTLMLLAIPMGINLIDFSFNRNSFRSRCVVLSTVAVLFCVLVATGGENNTGPLWLYVFPPLVFYLTGPLAGCLLALVCLGMTVVIFRFPELPLVTADYSVDFQLRFLLTLLFETVFCFVLDFSRRQTRTQLLEVARLFEYAARTDELTKLANRREMRAQLTKELARHERNEHPFSVVLIDVDFFKRINDQFGHEAGDQVLVEFAELLESLCRKADVASRWGGEEFLVLLPDTSLLQALILAERLRASTEAKTFVYGDRSFSITISAGVCSVAQHNTLESLLNQADHNLYEAKSQGRNRIFPRVKPSQPQPDGTAPNPGDSET